MPKTIASFHGCKKTAGVMMSHKMTCHSITVKTVNLVLLIMEH